MLTQISELFERHYKRELSRRYMKKRVGPLGALKPKSMDEKHLLAQCSSVIMAMIIIRSLGSQWTIAKLYMKSAGNVLRLKCPA